MGSSKRCGKHTKQENYSINSSIGLLPRCVRIRRVRIRRARGLVSSGRASVLTGEKVGGATIRSVSGKKFGSYAASQFPYETTRHYRGCDPDC